MKRITSIVAGPVFAVLTACGTFTAVLGAQDALGEIFTVPFAFTADGHEIGPGTYEVRRDMSQRLMSIQNVQTGEKELFSVRPENRHSSISVKGFLVFERCGDSRNLIEFHKRGTGLYSATIAPSRKKNLEVGICSTSGTTTVAAR
jgi:hypothetical protein